MEVLPLSEEEVSNPRRMINRSDGSPLVSIGIPVHNGAEHLSEAVESVLQQNYRRVEVIICDNASDDGTEQIAQSYAHRDERVRYVRHPSNIGFLPNFRTVRDLATGKYFGWLAHDDALSDPGYVRTVVDYMERHPDVVACTTAFLRFDPDAGRSDIAITLPELDAANWPASRRELFRWPHYWLDAAVYGLFKRESVAPVPIRERRHRGRSHIFCWEMDLLTRLSSEGPIVSLSERLRTYRASSAGTGNRSLQSVSSFDLLLIGLKMKLTLLRRASRMPGSFRERVRLLMTTVANFFRANFNQPYDMRYVMRWNERELQLLRKVAEERAVVIDSIRCEIDARRKIARELGTDGAVAGHLGDLTDLGESHDPTALPPIDDKRGSRGVLADFFRPLADWQVDHFNRLNKQLATYRELCEQQLQAIHREQSAAEAWLRLIDPSQPASSADDVAAASAAEAHAPGSSDEGEGGPQVRTGRPISLPRHARRLRWPRRADRSRSRGG